MDREGELLVLIDAEAFAETLRSLRATATVSHVLRPNLAVVSGASPDEVRGIPGVREVAAGDLPDETLAALDDTARTFVDAWRDRLRPRARRGDGLSWDAPGFEPPDRPPHV